MSASLTLTLLRSPESVPPQTRTVGGGEFTIGRGQGSDWILPDPDRHMSKRHCILAFRSDGWQVADLSANGTYLNREDAPIGQGTPPRPLRDGDRLRLGPYEIEVRIEGEAAHGILPGGRAQPAAINPFDEDPLAPPPRAGAVKPFGEDSLLRPQGEPGPGGTAPSIRLPDDYDPLAPEPDAGSFAGPTRPDHSAAVEDAFRPPPVAKPALPDDWDIETPAAPPPVAVPPPPLPAVALVPLEAAPPPLMAEAPPPEPAAPVRAAEPLQAAAPIASPAAAAAGDDDLMAVFLEGAGLAAQPGPKAPAAAMRALGAAFRAMVSGLRQALIARAAIKGEFRIEQTMIRPRGNNPLKFSADDEDALSALLGTGRRTDMGAAEAVADALRDMRLHELASVAAMQAAVRELLAQFDPADFRAAIEKEGGRALIPGKHKGQAWDRFETKHAAVTKALSDDFDSVFGKAFARAYEQALHEVSAREEREGER